MGWYSTASPPTRGGVMKLINGIPYNQYHREWRLKNKDKHRDYSRKKSRHYNKVIRDRRQNRLYELLILKNGCKDCGIKGPKEIYEFDHTCKSIDRISKENFKAYLNKSLKNVFKYLKQGEFVCANCHNIRSHKRGQFKGSKIK
tara:strand:+ start:245 stop:676 length:432 start_codon:yes stop_codon:yes gene_type:complete